jgi:hypothetical protein
MANKNQHVVPHGKNWAVKGAGNTKATSIHKTQKGAIDLEAVFFPVTFLFFLFPMFFSY